MSFLSSSYTQRIANHSNPAAKRLLFLMDSKQTNLSIAADVSTKAELLHIADTLGPYICILKTHIDIVSDFDQDLIVQLVALSKKHSFMIFEDRKFADIGNTVKLQYSKGIYHIADWADITNAHPLPGEGVVHGLKEVGLGLADETNGVTRGLLLIAEMSSKGSLATGLYSDAAVQMACRHRDFVFGFIGQNRLGYHKESTSSCLDDFIYMTPGVGMPESGSSTIDGDGLGQQYRTPQQVILDSHCDVIIVGRGIYGSKNMVERAKAFKEAGWSAYQQRIHALNRA
ncbi:hypothetical protein BDV3_006148 [Batrachochytrium dendrobatidis]